MKYWRNGKTDGIPFLMAIFRFIWLVPGVPIFVTLAAARKYTSDITEFLLANWQGSLSYSVITGIVLWLMTIYIQLWPSLVRADNDLKINKYGLLSSTIELDNIKEIKPYNLGPIGTLLHFRMKTNLSFREFLFLGKTKKEILSQFLSGHEIKIV